MPRRKAVTPVQEASIRQIPFQEVLEDRFSRYSKHIIQERALPDARDGLKPVQRRILWAMFEAHNTFDHPYHKSAKTVGNVIGNYHPHGDSSVYDAMVRMSQDWKIRSPLVDMQGNNGSIDDDPAAAMRYTEARLSKIAGFLLDDIDKDTVSWAPNFSDEKMEPTVLPARYPNLLVNGISGIAAGYATNIPPHNLDEVIDASIYRLQNPDADLDELMEIIKGPDFPTGGIAMGKEGIRNAFETGRGRVMVRARADIEQARNIQQIVITEIPYDVVKSSLVKKISEIQLSKKVDGILEVRDESGREGLRIVIDLKKEANAKAILDYLYKNTELQTSCNYNVVAIVNKAPVLMGLIPMLDAFLDHRKDVVTHRTQFTLNARKKRAHIVEGLIKAISVLDEVIALIKASKNKADSKKRLIERFEFSEQQAEAIVMLQLYRLSNTDIQTLKQEAKDLEKEIASLIEILENPVTRDNLIIKELQEVKSTFALPRKTDIQDEIAEITINPKEMIAREDFIVSLTKDGYLKKSSLRSFNSSNSLLPGLKEGDVPLGISKMNSMDNLLIVSSKSRLFDAPIYRLEETRWKDEGIHISSSHKLENQEKMVAGFVLPENFKKGQYLLATKNGFVSRMEFEPMQKSRLAAQMSLGKDDVLRQAVFLDDPDQEIILLTKNGKIFQMSAAEISMRQGKSKGMRAITLDEDDELLTMLKANYKDYLLLTENGLAKKIGLDQIPRLSRGSKGQQAIAKSHNDKAFALVGFDGPVTLFQKEKMELNPEEFKTFGKLNAKGTKVLDMNEPVLILQPIGQVPELVEGNTTEENRLF